VRAGLVIYFRRIERFHTERAPSRGPVLFVSNHPGSVADAFIISTAVPRLLHFVATVKLFKWKPLAALLLRCGVVPVNRRQDDAHAMHTVSDTFAACHRVLDAGGAIGIFPEGMSYDDDQLRPIKTGTARIALEAEDRHDGRLGLRIAPVGLTYAAKGRYRSDVLVHFGEPLMAADWLGPYRANHHDGVRALSAAIEQRIRDLILSVPSLEHQRIVDAVKRLYLDRLRAGNLIVAEPVSPRAEDLLISQAIAQALAFVESKHPDRLAAFVGDLARYERRLSMLGLRDESIAALEPSGAVPAPGPLAVLGLVLGAPIAAYGWLHRLAPVWFVEWAVAKFSPRENLRAQMAHGSMIAGLVAFGIIYAAAAGLMWHFAGWRVAALYLASLPLSGLFAVRYLRALHRYAGRIKGARILLRLPLTRRNLARTRERLVRQIEWFGAGYRRDVRQGGEGSPNRASAG